MTAPLAADQLGLAWPEGFRSLRPLIQEWWGVGGEFFMSSQLSGRSSALVYSVDIASNDFTGQAMLKLDHASDAEGTVKSEEERLCEACECAPTFAARHLPRLLHTLHDGDNVAILVQRDQLDDARAAVKDALRARLDLTRSRLEQCWHELTPEYLNVLLADLRKVGQPE